MYQDEIRLKYTDGKTLVVTECLSLDTEKWKSVTPKSIFRVSRGLLIANCPK